MWFDYIFPLLNNVILSKIYTSNTDLRQSQSSAIKEKKTNKGLLGVQFYRDLQIELSQDARGCR